MFSSKRSRIRRVERQIKRVKSYAQWYPLAEELDQLTGAEAWRREEASSLYHPELLKAHTARMRALRQDNEPLKLLYFLQESLHRNLGDISAPGLYTRALAGTKPLTSAP